MTFSIQPLRVIFNWQTKKTLLHFITFHFGPYHFSEFSDDGHKTKRQARAFGKRVCDAVNSK